jgi:hypothetical protein
MDQVATRVLEASITRDWDTVRLLLHPYLHWSDHNGVTLRGRTNVLQWLAARQAPLAPPTRIELRNGQIYRWTS